MSILERFNDVIKANVNALIDRMEDPGKMIDQYLRERIEDLAEVRRSAAGVMAEEARTARLLEENKAETAKYAGLAKRALAAGNEGDARVFIAKKLQLEKTGQGLAEAHAVARDNAVKIRRMHDKLAGDIETLEARRKVVEAKLAVARSQETLNKAAASAGGAGGVEGAFDRMEAKADRMLDKAAALAELQNAPVDEAEALEGKYAAASVDDELESMKRELGL